MFQNKTKHFLATVFGLPLSMTFLTGCLESSSVVLPSTPAPITTVSSVPMPSCKTGIQSATQNFNVLVFNDFSAPSSDVEGRLAAGRDVQIANYSVGAVLTRDASRSDIIAGRNLTFTSGDVPNGKISYGNSISMTAAATSLGAPVQESPLSFTVAYSELSAISQSLALRTPNKTTSVQYSGSRAFVTLNADDPVINVFGISSTDLANTHTLTVQGSSTTSVVVNVSGTSAQMSNFAMILSGGITHDKILFHFPDATSLTVTDVAVEGSVIAPKANLNFPHGLIIGQVVASSATGAGQYNHAPFSGCLPVESSTVFVRDALLDSTGGNVYEIYGIAVRQLGDYIIVGLNSNTPLAGTTLSGHPIGLGDFIMNFSSNLTSFGLATTPKTFGVHFAQNGSTKTVNGLYRDVTTISVANTHNGWTRYGDYLTYVVNSGQIVALGNVDAFNYFNQTTALPNVINTGMLVTNSEFQSLSATDLAAFGMDFALAFGLNPANLGSQSTGFIFKRPSDMTGPYVLHISPDCANDAAAINFRLE